MKLLVLHVLKFPNHIILISICIKNYSDNYQSFLTCWEKIFPLDTVESASESVLQRSVCWYYKTYFLKDHATGPGARLLRETQIWKVYENTVPYFQRASSKLEVKWSEALNLLKCYIT